MIPCEECIALAMCKQKSEIRCDKLHKFVHQRNSFPKELKKVINIRHSNGWPVMILFRGSTRWFPES